MCSKLRGDCTTAVVVLAVSFDRAALQKPRCDIEFYVSSAILGEQNSK